ncbi:MAG: ISL3 family transposase [Solirubrobacteraceae bacterium]
MSCASPSQPWIRSAATSGTPTSAPTPRPGSGSRAPAGRCLKSPEKQTIDQLSKLGEVQQANRPLYRAFLLKEELRLLYQLEDPSLAPAHLDAWLAWASRSKLRPFVKLARTIRQHKAGVLAAIKLGISNECTSYCTSW